MRKTGVLVFFLLVTVFTSESYSSPYILIDGGGGGASEAGSMGFGFGGTKAIRDKYPMELSISFGFTNDVPSDLLDYPVPHSDYRLLGDKNNGNEYGLLLKFGIPLGENINIMLGGGGSFQKVDLIAQSNVTGWYYTQSSKTQSYLTGYGGLLFKTGRIMLSAGYENRRGIIGGIGWTW